MTPVSPTFYMPFNPKFPPVEGLTYYEILSLPYYYCHQCNAATVHFWRCKRHRRILENQLTCRMCGNADVAISCNGGRLQNKRLCKQLNDGIKQIEADRNGIRLCGGGYNFCHGNYDPINLTQRS